jgi:hypothetical protein
LSGNASTIDVLPLELKQHVRVPAKAFSSSGKNPSAYLFYAISMHYNLSLVSLAVLLQRKN